MCDGVSEAIMIGAMVASAAGASYSAYNSYQQGKAQNAQAKAQAAEMERQAELNRDRAGIAQLQGEQEAARRARILSAHIGSTYANWAGNGLLVDGGGRIKDSLTSIVGSQTKEGQADISTIRDNTSIDVWTYLSNAESDKASALNRRVYGSNMKKAGVNSAFATGFSGAGQVMGMGAKGAEKYGWGQSRTFS